MCVIDIETINIIILTGERCKNKIGKLEIIVAEIRFICIPGNKPVNVPARMPPKKEIIN
jgi:hypothetical protein